MPMMSVDDEHEFPWLQQVAANTDATIAALRPSVMDELGIEVSKVLTRCSVPESSVSVKERGINETMCACINVVDIKLSQRTDAHSCAMLRLFLRVVMTPYNFQALCTMCDPAIRTGDVRRYAQWHICRLTQVRSAWSIKFQDGSSLALNVIKTMANKILDPAAVPPIAADPGNWSVLCEALGMCNEPVPKVVDELAQCDWRSILHKAAFYVDSSTGKRGGWDSSVFLGVHGWAIRALQIDNNSARAKELLQKLGSCKTTKASIMFKSNWRARPHETAEASWQRFERSCLHTVLDSKYYEDRAKKIQKGTQSYLKSTANLSGGEMCANCYILETSLDNSKLLKCSQCRQIKYCSRECQREHWKKAHKEHCKKV